MDFLDPAKQRRHTILLMIGYVLIAIAIAISTLVLIWQANGFSVNGKGQVVQSGFVFVSSQPSGARIYLNNTLQSAKTGARIKVPSGAYTLKLTRTGYHNWSHPLGVVGGDVQHFDYPFLFPLKLDTTSTVDLPAATGVTAQSPDRRWLLVQQKDTNTFDFYDVKDPKSIPAPDELAVPATAIDEPNIAHTWSVVSWAGDNQHVLMAHTVSSGTEYVLLDRTDAGKTVNLNTLFKLAPANLALLNTKYNQFSILSADGVLSTATLDNPELVQMATGVLSYKTYNANQVVYATATDAPAGKVNILLQDDDRSYLIRTLAADTTYLLDMASYRGTPYVIAGSAADGAVYTYKDPEAQLRSDNTLKSPSALSVLRVKGATYESFSPTAQYVVVENGTSFGVQDLYLHRFRYYTAAGTLDAPQAHAKWMDGNRLTYVSDGKFTVMDFDDRNPQTLMAATADAGAFFAPDYKYVYALNTDAAGAVHLVQTSLLTAADR